LATRSHLQIYSVATSLLVRSLKVTPAEITSYALSESKPTQIFAATSTGLITSWDLDTGKRLGRWDMESDIHGIFAILPPGGSQDIMFTQEAITNEAGKRNVINAHILRTGAQTSESEVKMALKTDKSILSFQVLSSGGIIVVALQGSIMIGKAQSSTLTSLKDLVYIWREFKVQESITSFHARVAPQSGSVTLSKKGSSKVSLDSLDLAVGCADGAIVLYDDILSKLQSIEKAEKSKNNKPEQSDNLLPRRLHWHRDGVPSLKWSKDGTKAQSWEFVAR
jgi:NET1-associated nuclear protein 1 (U3 small nucleolar RNA-associated protein 17)